LARADQWGISAGVAPAPPQVIPTFIATSLTVLGASSGDHCEAMRRPRLV
jgi:hypothetical protein